ncbi:MAG: bifunctional nuclease family protein [Chloroflexi bacterium]|nr:bifunctional nuclease family protein [Chloroflexota bacterium]
MVEVTVESIRVSLVTQHRMVVLKEMTSDRYLPIWIGAYEADAITLGLQGVAVARPLTHDLLKSVIEEVGGRITHIVVNDLRDETYFARIVMEVNGQSTEIDSRPSDAIALAVRVHVPIYVAESVMDRAAVAPGEELEAEPEATSSLPKPTSQEEEDRLSVFKDFVEGLDMEGLGDDED